MYDFFPACDSAVKRAGVAYYRHSAEDKQENSVPIQREQARLFAEKYAIDLIHEEIDEGMLDLQPTAQGFADCLNPGLKTPQLPRLPTC